MRGKGEGGGREGERSEGGGREGEGGGRGRGGRGREGKEKGRGRRGGEESFEGRGRGRERERERGRGRGREGKEGEVEEQWKRGGDDVGIGKTKDEGCGECREGCVAVVVGWRWKGTRPRVWIPVIITLYPDTAVCSAS